MTQTFSFEVVCLDIYLFLVQTNKTVNDFSVVLVCVCV